MAPLADPINNTSRLCERSNCSKHLQVTRRRPIVLASRRQLNTADRLEDTLRHQYLSLSPRPASMLPMSAHQFLLSKPRKRLANLASARQKHFHHQLHCLDGGLQTLILLEDHHQLTAIHCDRILRNQNLQRAAGRLLILAKLESALWTSITLRTTRLNLVLPNDQNWRH